jgi:hypothetical protein
VGVQIPLNPFLTPSQNPIWKVGVQILQIHGPHGPHRPNSPLKVGVQIPIQIPTAESGCPDLASWPPDLASWPPDLVLQIWSEIWPPDSV